MNLITSKSLMTRLCLMSCILLSIVFTSENAFSIPWKDTPKEVFYYPQKGYITIKLQSFYYKDDEGKALTYNYISDLDIQYAGYDKVYSTLLSAEIRSPGDAESIWAKFKSINNDGTITFRGGIDRYINPFRWLEMKVKKEIDLKQGNDNRSAFFEVVWKLPKTVKYIKFKGKWVEFVKTKIKSKTFEEVVNVDHASLKQKTPKESDNDVKLNCNEGIITVSNVNPGENIKVYNSVSGAEVTSVVAKGDVVDINLKKNQSYFVKVGAKIIKATL